MKPLVITLASFLGAVGYTLLMGFLDARFRPFSSDIPAWIFVSIPTGAVLSGVSAYAVLDCLGKEYWTAGLTCIFTSVLSLWFYIDWYRDDSHIWSPKYALSETGPALLWSSCILAFGLYLLVRHTKARRQFSS
jgi:hypothetical protein